MTRGGGGYIFTNPFSKDSVRSFRLKRLHLHNRSSLFPHGTIADCTLFPKFNGSRSTNAVIMQERQTCLPRIPADKSNCLYILLDDARSVLKQYIKHYESKVKSIKGSGLKKLKRWKCCVFQ